MVELIVWLVSVLAAVGAAIIVVQLIARPMRALLGSNSYMACAERFYIRAFALAVYLSTLASVVGRSVPGSKEADKSMSRIKQTYYPNEKWTQLYQEKYEQYKQLYPSLKNFNRSISVT